MTLTKTNLLNLIFWVCILFMFSCNESNKFDYLLDESDYNLIEENELQLKLDSIKNTECWRKVDILRDISLSALVHDEMELFFKANVQRTHCICASGHYVECEFSIFRLINDWEEKLNASQIRNLVALQIGNSSYYNLYRSKSYFPFIMDRMDRWVEEGRMTRRDVVSIYIGASEFFEEKEYMDLLREAEEIGIDSATILFCKALFYREKGNHERAYEDFESLLEIFEKRGKKFRNYSQMGVFYRYVNQLDSAEKYLTLALDTTHQSWISYHIIPYINLGHLYHLQGKTDMALEIARKAFEKAKIVGHSRHQQEALTIMKKCYQDQGNLEGNLEALEKERNLLINNETLLFEQYNLGQIVLFSKETELKKRRNRFWIISGSVLGFFLLLGFILSNYYGIVLRLQRKTKELGQIRKKLDHVQTKATETALKNDLKVTAIKDLKNMLMEPNLDEKSMRKIMDRLKDMDSDWDEFKSGFSLTYPNFYAELLNRNPKLTSLDLKHATYIKLNLTTNEVSKILGINNRSVSISRYRLKKKLKFDSAEGMSQFIHSL